MSNTNPYVLVDASVYVFRAWHSIPEDMTTPGGEPVNAVYGFTRFLTDLLRRSKSAPVAVAFDESLSTSFRNEIFPDYKANRPPAPDELKRQFAWCQECCDVLGVPWLAHERWEADDIIGTWAAQAREQDFSVTVVTRDKDLAQILTPGDTLWDFAADKRMGLTEVREKFGVEARQIADYLALTGDAVDNIPGVRGVGPKAASALLNAFDTLDGVYRSLDRVAELPIRGAKSLAAKLTEHEAMARLSRRLTGIPTDLDIEPPRPERSAPDPELIDAWCNAMGFGAGMRRAMHNS